MNNRSISQSMKNQSISFDGVSSRWTSKKILLNAIKPRFYSNDDVTALFNDGDILPTLKREAS